MYFLLFFFILILFLINLNLICHINISRKNNINNIYFCIKIYRLNFITIKIPFLNIDMDSNDNIYLKFKQNIKIRKNIIEDKDKKLSLTYIIYSIKKINNKKLYYLFIKNSYKNIVIKDLILNTKIGYEDAHICAILHGLLHILKSNSIYYLNSKIHIINSNYFVNTIYNRNILEFDYKIVIKIKVIYIIKATLISIFKLKEGE